MCAVIRIVHVFSIGGHDIRIFRYLIVILLRSFRFASLWFNLSLSQLGVIRRRIHYVIEILLIFSLTTFAVHAATAADGQEYKYSETYLDIKVLDNVHEALFILWGGDCLFNVLYLGSCYFLKNWICRILDSGVPICQ